MSAMNSTFKSAIQGTAFLSFGRESPILQHAIGSDGREGDGFLASRVTKPGEINSLIFEFSSLFTRIRCSASGFIQRITISNPVLFTLNPILFTS